MPMRRFVFVGFDSWLDYSPGSGSYDLHRCDPNPNPNPNPKPNPKPNPDPDQVRPREVAARRTAAVRAAVRRQVS